MAVKLGAKSIVLVLILILAIALIVGALAWSRTSSLYLPLPTWLPATATLLSPLTAAALALINLANRQGVNAFNSRRNIIISALDQLHSAILTMIASVALAYLFPDNILSCHLEQQWLSYYRSKSAHPIRTIQDNFQCCGLRSIHDRAWPFKDRDHGDNACELQLGYQRSCFTPWREQQQVASWMVVAAAVMIWLVKIGLIQVSRNQPSWMSGVSSADPLQYQRITQESLEEEAEESDHEPRDAGVGRTLLPHTGPSYSDWRED